MSVSMVRHIPGALPGITGPSMEGLEKADQGDGFGALLERAVDKVDESQRAADAKLGGLASARETDIHGTMIALQEADISLRALVSVRDKLVDGYQELMNMSI